MESDRFELRADRGDFPDMLMDVVDIAPVIYGRGNPNILFEPCFSIIGARRASPYGLSVAQMAARIAAESGICVVSGGAIGCDRAAGQAALEAGGKTIVVSGCGADQVYPKSSRKLFEDAISCGGAVISIEEWGTPPLRGTFPKRNNVIAALSISLLVTEAGIPSGTFSTATAAANLGRNVYAVPGSIFSPNSQGANSLIESGAAIIVDEKSLETRISMDYGLLRLVAQTERKDLDPIMHALVASPMRVDELCDQLKFDRLSLIKSLANYEAKGFVTQLNDGRYAPTEAAYLYQGGRA